MRSLSKVKKKHNLKEKLKNKKLMLATWGCEVRDHYHYTEWCPILANLFRNLLVFSPRTNYFKYGKEKMNDLFLSTIKKEKPDYLLLSMNYDEFEISTLLSIKEISPNTKIIHFSADDEWRYDDWSRYYCLFFDYVLVAEKNIEGYAKDGVKNVFYFHGSSSKQFKPLDVKKIYDVTFIGMPIADRYEYVRFLYNHGIKINVFGRGWENHADLKEIYKGYLNQEDYIRVINESKINLSFSKGALPGSKGGQIKGRLFEIAACRSFGLTEYTERNTGFFKKKEVNFKTKEELLNKIKFYLKNPIKMEELAKKSYEDFIKNHTWEDKFELLFSLLLDEEKVKINSLPEVKEKAIFLQPNELFSNNLLDKIKNVDYVSFYGGKNNLTHQKYFQTYSLNKSKKEISCCDYYANSNGLGDYLLFTAKKAYYNTKRSEFIRFINLSQLMVKKDFLINNLYKFRQLALGKSPDLVNENNTVFVSIPLVRISSLKEANYESMKNAFQMKFRDKLYILYKKKKIFYNSYVYRIILESLFKRKFILEYLLKEICNKDNWYRKKNLL